MPRSISYAPSLRADALGPAAISRAKITLIYSFIVAKYGQRKRLNKLPTSRR